MQMILCVGSNKELNEVIKCCILIGNTGLQERDVYCVDNFYENAVANKNIELIVFCSYLKVSNRTIVAWKDAYDFLRQYTDKPILLIDAQGIDLEKLMNTKNTKHLSLPVEVEKLSSAIAELSN